MPTYEYACDACGRTYEVWQRISATPLTHCQYCSGPVRRLLSPAPFILKGGGWYVTDYPSESRKKAMEAEKKSGAPSESAKSDGGGSKSGSGAAGTSGSGSGTEGSSPGGSAAGGSAATP